MWGTFCSEQNEARKFLIYEAPKVPRIGGLRGILERKPEILHNFSDCFGLRRIKDFLAPKPSGQHNQTGTVVEIKGFYAFGVVGVSGLTEGVS